MIRRLGALGVCLTCAAIAAPSPARAGIFTVRACQSDGINNSWQSYHSNGYADAYVQCPGGAIVNGHVNDGMIARNTGGPGTAPGFSNASVYFDAPSWRPHRPHHRANHAEQHRWLARGHP